MVRSTHCVLCGARFVGRYLIVDKHQIFRCSRCGLLFALSMRGASAPSYDEEYFEHFVERDRQDELLSTYDDILLKAEAITSGRRLLDVGCGSGGFLLRARERGWDVCGVDGSPAAIEIVKSHGIDASVADLNGNFL